MLKLIARSGTWRVVAGIVAFTAVIGSPPAGAAQELRIGFVAPTTGAFSQIGRDMVNGFQLYLDEVGGNFAGAKVTFIVEDEEAKPPVAVRKVEKLIRQDKVHMFVGGLLASTGYAIAPVSTRLKTVYVASIPAPIAPPTRVPGPPSTTTTQNVQSSPNWKRLARIAVR